MKPIVFVTSNKGKFEEVSGVLNQFGIKIVMRKFDLPELQIDEIETISMGKAKAAYAHFKKPVIVEDTGVFFSAYDNFPGAYSKQMFRSLKLEGLLKLLEKNRDAYFKTVISYANKGKVRQFEGVCKGIVPIHPVGELDERLPYDPIFIPEGESRCFSQMTKTEKEKYSSRGIASTALAKFLVK